MSNNKQSSVDFIVNLLIEKGYAGVLNEDEIEEAKAIHNSEMQTKYEDGREIGKIEVLTTQSTNNAGAYSDGYKKGYLAALEYMNSTIENKIKLRQYEK